MSIPQAPVSADGIYSVRSDKLKELRALIKTWKDFEKVIGGAVQFRIVVDTNVVLGHIRWLAFKRKNETARTSMMEAIEAGTIDVYVPPSLFDEVEEHIDRIAEEEGQDREAMLAHRRHYQTKLKVCEPDNNKVQRLQGGVDPDDAFFVALAETVAAQGIVSNDHHIEKMGGNRISVDCIVSLRDYSRATAIELNIKCMGVMLGWTSIAAVRGMFAAIKALMDGISKAPDWLKLALLAGGAFCVLHPGAREVIVRGLKAVLAGIEEATPALISHLAKAATLAEQNKGEAQTHLSAALEELNRSASA